MPYKDPEQRKAYKKQWREKNSEKYAIQNRECVKRYKLKNPLVDRNRSRAEKLNIPVADYTDDLWDARKKQLKVSALERRRAQRNLSKKSQYQRAKEWLWQYKMTLQCTRCPVSHPAALAFHHVRDKRKDVSKCGTVTEMKREIEKCVVLCHNCHAIEHYNIRQSTKNNHLGRL